MSATVKDLTPLVSCKNCGAQARARLHHRVGPPVLAAPKDWYRSHTQSDVYFCSGACAHASGLPGPGRPTA